MSKHMARDLEKIQKLILTMAGAVEEAIYRATTALQDRNPTLAQKVIEGDASVDKLENEVQDECLKMLALHQPVAVDLRRVCTVLLISTDLERMGDLAVGIAERALTLATVPLPPVADRIARMTARTTDMVRRSLDAFVKSDAAAARAVIRMDDEVDRDNAAIIAEVISAMQGHPDAVEPGLSLFSAVRHLERIADHATNVAEDVVYLAEGEMVRHRPTAVGSE